MSYKLVDRKTPKGLKEIKFNFKNDSKFGMINLCCWHDEINKIENYNKKIINNTKIYIYFPMFDYFYVKEYSSKNGFTFKQLVDKIVKTGLQAGKYDTKHNPEHYFGPATEEDFIGEYAITWSERSSDIQIKGNKIFISVQH